MRSYPIWNIVKATYDYTAGIYKNGRGGAKNYGVEENGKVEIRVGTSASNSHHFLTHTTTHRLFDNGDREYRFYIDNKLITSASLKKGATELERSTALLGSAYHEGIQT